MSNNNNNKKLKKSRVQILHRLEKDDLDAVNDLINGSRKSLSTPAADYLHAVVDPQNAKLCGIPTLIGGEPGRTTVRRFKIAGTMATGTAGVGFISIGDPVYDGFYSDRLIGHYTDNSYTGSTLNSTSATVGVNNLVFLQSPYTCNGVVSAHEMIFHRLVGLCIKIVPIGSALAQDGTITLMEYIGCPPASNDSLDTIRQYENSRTISAIQFGDQGVEIALNLHPTGSSQTGVNQRLGPFEFTAQNTANTTAITHRSAAIMVTASAGLSFSFEIYAIYEYRGFKARSGKARLTDSRGMDLVLSVFRHKQLSGWLGQPQKALKVYHAKLGHVNALDEPRETKISETLPKEERKDWSSWRNLWDAAKEGYSLIKEIGGLF